MTPDDAFNIYKDLLQKESGHCLTPDKAYLLDSRLGPIAKKWDYPDLESMAKAMKSSPSREIVKDIVEAMTTNETLFFRDSRPFDLFRDELLPYMLKNRTDTKRIKIWCAACSSGQEPYSLAMLLKENAHLWAGWKIDITATDISTEIIESAKKAAYTQFEIQRGLPIQMLMKYFEQKDDRWVIKPDITGMVNFKYFNLLDEMSALGNFDIIFCRNVLIYFDTPTKAGILDKMARVLPHDGFLLLGGAETVIGINDTFKALEGRRGVYIRQDSSVQPDSLSGKTDAKALAS